MKSRLEAQKKLILHLQNNMPGLLKSPLTQDIKILQKNENARFEIRVGSDKKELATWWKLGVFVLITPTENHYHVQVESKFERWPKDIEVFAVGHKAIIKSCTDNIGMAVKESFGNDGGTVQDIRTEDKFVLKITSNINIETEITEDKSLNSITILFAKIAQLAYNLSQKILTDSQVITDDSVFAESEAATKLSTISAGLDYVTDWNLDNEQVLVLAGDWAFNIADKYGIYECQNKRTFRPSKYMAFYKNSQIDTLFEIIEQPYDNGTGKNTPEMAAMKKDMLDYDDVSPRRVIKLKKLQKVGPIINDGKSKSGKTVPFTYGQPRYTTFELITKAKVTSELVHGIKGIEIIDTLILPKKDEAKADILFVVDNSGSMGSYQRNLSSNIEKFITIFANSADIPDFKLGICTTDSSSVKTFSKADLMRDKNSFVNSFKSAIMVGTWGSATERGLEMALRSVKSSFSRSEALLFVNIISDEDDDSTNTPSYYVEQMKLVKGNKKVTINAIYESTTAKHHNAAKLTNGICARIDSDYGSLLTNIGRNVMELIKTVPLSETPNDVSRIEVQRNKKAVSDWKYNSNLNSIDFTSPQKENDIIDVIYFIDEKE